jgi:hypothetical protein
MDHFGFKDTNSGVYGVVRSGLDSTGGISWYGVSGIEGKFDILQDTAAK